MVEMTNMIKTIIGLWGIIGSIIIFAIGTTVFLAFCKNDHLMTDDGKETNFYKKLGMIHYLYSSNAFSLIYSPVYGADAKTFKPIGGGFGKDNKYIYYMQTKQPHVDYQTFEILGDGTYRDNNHEYEIGHGEILKPIITKYRWFEAFIENNRPKIKIGDYGMHEDGIKNVEKQISFKLPDSYKWFAQKYGFIEIYRKLRDTEYVKYVDRPLAWDSGSEREILRMYKYNRKNRNFPKHYLSILDYEDETFLFLMETGIKDNEYKVYKMDNSTGTITLFADDFLRFLEMRINDADGYINWQRK